MKLSRRLDGSVCGAILSARPVILQTNLPCRHVPSRVIRGKHTIAQADNRERRGSFFCPNTSVWLRSIFQLPSKSPCSVIQARNFSASWYRANEADAAATAAASSIDVGNVQYTKDELLQLIDQQETGPVNDYLEFHRDPYLRRYAQPDGPNITVSEKIEDSLYPSREEATHGDPQIEKISDQLMSAALLRRRHPARISLDSLYNLYYKLPEPRMLYISARLRWRLLRVFGIPDRRDVKTMLRYFGLVNDVKKAGLTLRLQEWNFALSFASRYVRTTSEIEADAALKLWSEMERDAGIKSNEVTFNILFDVASKAGNFTLAELIYKEMENRRIPFNRYHHVSLIHYFGLKQDGDGVRAAYREMVEAGEMIDTVVLNCVISGLLMAGEDLAAEEVYERMKTGATQHLMPQRDYFSDKVMTKVLMMFGKLGKEHPDMRPTFQKTAQLTPDLQTYRILIRHFALKTGNLPKITQLLDEMKWFKVPLHGGIFLLLFRAFTLHGGFDGAAWSEQRLRGVFSALMQAVNNGLEGLSIEVWLAMWVIRAFKKCASDAATRDAYDQLREHMKLNQGQETFIDDFLYDVLHGRDLSLYRKKSWSQEIHNKRARRRRRIS